MVRSRLEVVAETTRDDRSSIVATSSRASAPQPAAAVRKRRGLSFAVAAVLITSLLALGKSTPVQAGLRTPTDRDYKFRTTFGLTTDPSEVAAITASIGASPNWGVPLSAAEEAIMASRSRVADQVPALQEALEKEDGFAGLWIDQAAGGVIEVMTTQSAAATIQGRTAALAPSEAQFRFRVVANSLATLNGLRDQFGPQMLAGAKGAGTAITSLTVDIPRNVVVVGLDPSTFASDVKALSSQGTAVPVIYEPAERLKTASCTRDNCSPLRAGLAITDPALCTSNFSAYAGFTHYLLTAGHCGARGNTFKHNGQSIGTVSLDRFYSGTSADVLSIDLLVDANHSNLVYINSATQRAMTSKIPLNGDSVGDPACGSGDKTGFFCGNVLNADIAGLAEGNVVINHLSIASINVRQGDSGGPLFYGNRAMGVTSLVNGNKHTVGTDVWWDNLMYNEVRYEEQEIGLTIYIG